MPFDNQLSSTLSYGQKDQAKQHVCISSSSGFAESLAFTLDIRTLAWVKYDRYWNHNSRDHVKTEKYQAYFPVGNHSQEVRHFVGSHPYWTEFYRKAAVYEAEIEFLKDSITYKEKKIKGMNDIYTGDHNNYRTDEYIKSVKTFLKGVSDLDNKLQKSASAHWEYSRVLSGEIPMMHVSMHSSPNKIVKHLPTPQSYYVETERTGRNETIYAYRAWTKNPTLAMESLRKSQPEVQKVQTQILDSRIVLGKIKDTYLLTSRSSMSYRGSEVLDFETIRSLLELPSVEGLDTSPLSAIIEKYDAIQREISPYRQRLQELKSEYAEYREQRFSLFDKWQQSIHRQKHIKTLTQKRERILKAKAAERARIARVKRLAEQRAEEARILAEKMEIWNNETLPSIQAKYVTGTKCCGCTDSEDNPKNWYATRVEAVGQALTQMQGNEGLELEQYSCTKGHRAPNGSVYRAGGFHNTKVRK